MKPVLIILTVAAFSQCGARQLSRCGLVRELRRNGFPESKMRDWVCLVEKESGRRTHVISKRNRNGSRDYGLFQINDNYWCSRTNKPGKDCNVTCKQLVTNNISRAATCAKKIYQRHGFDAWYGWKNHCRGKRLPNISSCKK